MEGRIKKLKFDHVTFGGMFTSGQNRWKKSDKSKVELNQIRNELSDIVSDIREQKCNEKCRH